MSARVASHIRSNVIGYLALFVALSGSAYAVTAPRNTVSSKSIKNGQVKSIDAQDNGFTSVDLQDGGVGGVDLQDGGVAGADLLDGGVGSADLQDGAVASAEILDGGVQGVDLANGAVQPANLAPSAIGAPGFARISSNGTVSRSRGVTGVEHTMGSAFYCISTSFPAQVAVASADAGPGSPDQNVQVQVPGGPAGVGCDADQVGVVTEGPAAADEFSFFIVIN